jgi:hypothetical protein
VGWGGPCWVGGQPAGALLNPLSAVPLPCTACPTHAQPPPLPSVYPPLCLHAPPPGTPPVTPTHPVHRPPAQVRPAAEAHLGLLGPLLRAEVGDALAVTLLNRVPGRNVSLHPHGVLYGKDAEGAPYNDGTSGTDRWGWAGGARGGGVGGREGGTGRCSMAPLRLSPATGPSHYIGC